MRTENEQHPQHFDVKLVMEPAETINNQIAVMETLAEMQAQDLCEWFKEERKNPSIAGGGNHQAGIP